MDSFEILKKTIDSKKTIRFEYDKPGKIQGVRVGNPHAIYAEPTTGNILVDIYQIDGVSDSVNDGKKILPDWNRFLISHIANIEITDENFEAAPGYNPQSPRYIHYIHLLS